MRFTLALLLMLAHGMGSASAPGNWHLADDPCGRFGKLFSAAVGIGAGLDRNSFEQDTLVHTRVLTDAGYQTKLKPIKDIQVGDEVLAWDELQAHDNAALAQSGQAAKTLQAAHSQADSQNTGNSSIKSASSAINTGANSYENNSIKGIKSAQRYEKVTDIASLFKEQTLLHITLSNGQTIQATAGHPFKTREGWRDAVLLKKGGQLLLGGDADKETYTTITDIREEVKTTAVFNLEVANLHTFFVGVEGVVVHNGSTANANRTAGKQFEKDVAADFNRNSPNGNTAEVGGKGVAPPFGIRFPDITIRNASGAVTGYLECKKGNARYNSSQRAKDEFIKRQTGVSTTVVRGL